MAREARTVLSEWLGLNDEELIHRIEGLGKQHGQDALLMDLVASDRHFFVRQVAAKKIEDHKLLHEHWADRDIGQILVRGVSRSEDVAYLQALVRQTRHADVRAAAEAQLKSTTHACKPNVASVER
jgi:hypothetical protein